jgi:predicted transcriptional regulator
MQRDQLSITGPQIRGARSMLGLTQKELAAAASVSEPTIKRLEGQPGALTGHSTTIAAVVRALEDRGAIFISENGEGPGVRLRKGL